MNVPHSTARSVASARPEPAASFVTTEDRELCKRMLPEVSRTFALSIAALPDSLRDAVQVAYLLCRIVDTIEDEVGLDGSVRIELYDAFDTLLGDDGSDPHAFERHVKELRLGGDGSCYHALCSQAGAPFRVFRALTPEQRAAIRPHVQEMSRGMREFTTRADATGKLRLADLDELERYCHYVAGTVGKLLTKLFEQTVPNLAADRRAALRARAVSFGIGLQLVNIVKDVAEDLERGDCFLPEGLAAEQGIALDDILDPRHRPAGLAIVRAVCARARQHLRRAEEYIALWPSLEAEPVRLFCAVPLALALTTLREVELGEDTLVAGRTPKITREVVMQLFADASVAVGRNDTLAWMLAYYGSGSYVDPIQPPLLDEPRAPRAEPAVQQTGANGAKGESPDGARGIVWQWIASKRSAIGSLWAKSQ